MKRKLPWTRLRIVIATLGILSLLIALYGVWIILDGQNLVEPTGDPSSVNAIGGIYLISMGFALSAVAGSLTIILGIIYVIVVRNLGKANKSSS